mgnify:CR=1 FL=1
MANKNGCQNEMMGGQQCDMRFTSVIGHVLELEFQAPYGGNNWHACDPVDLFKAPVAKREKKENENLVRQLKESHNECKNCFVILQNGPTSW